MVAMRTKSQALSAVRPDKPGMTTKGINYLCAHYGKINEANVVAGSLLTDITEPKVFYGNSL